MELKLTLLFSFLSHVAKYYCTNIVGMLELHLVREPVIVLIKWLRPKSLKVCSYVETCAEFKNQTLKKIGRYTKVLCVTEYHRGMQYLKWGYPCMFIL